MIENTGAPREVDSAPAVPLPTVEASTRTPRAAPDSRFRIRPWQATLFAVVGGIVAFYALGSLGFFDLAVVVQLLPTGLSPLKLSLEFTTLSFAVGFFLAIPLGVLRAFPPGRRVLGSESPRRATRWLKRVLLPPAYGFATGYVAVVRGTPFLVQIFVVYYAVIFAFPTLNLLGQPPEFWAALLALTINTTGYQAEALRGGFQSVDSGQIEAAKAIGMSGWQVFRRIVLPQSIRLVTLPLTNEWISNFKTSTILSYISIYEVFAWSRTYVALYLGRPVEALVMLIVFYLIINVTVSRTATYLEQRRRIPGLGSILPEFGARVPGASTAAG